MSHHITSADHTTHYFDSERLDAAQLDGAACVICGTSDGPMKPVATVPGHGQVFACTGETPAQPTDIESVTQAMRDALGVDQVTGLDLAEAVKVGMLLGSMLRQPDGDKWPAEVGAAFYAEEVSEREHRILTEAVADVLTLRMGETPRRTQEAMLAYQLGYASSARLAEEFGPRSLPASLKDVGEHFTAEEMGELMAALDRVIARRRGELPAEWQPVTLPVDWAGRCGDAACLSCHGETVEKSA